MPDQEIDGLLDVVLDETTVFQPDVLVVHHSRRDIIGETAVWGAPEIVIEVASKTSGKQDRARKMPLYLRFGVPEVWLVVPEERAVSVVTGAPGQPQESRYVMGEEVISERFGLRLPLGAVFGSM